MLAQEHIEDEPVDPVVEPVVGEHTHGLATLPETVDAALALSPAGRLGAPAAEALRIAARLLDSPLPPAVAACFVEVQAAA